MKQKITQRTFALIAKITAFVGAVTIVFFLMPRVNHFGYSFEVGKPWQHDLLVATYDFPIYKNSEEIQKEKDSLVKQLVPYFVVNEKIADEQIHKFYKESDQHIDETSQHYVAQCLRKVYTQGIVSPNELEALQKMGVQKIAIIDNNTKIGEKQVDKLLTTKQAYKDIFRHIEEEDLQETKALNINNFLVENLTMDAKKTEQIKKDLFATISPTYGLVQAGERIIDRGEIVSVETYKIIDSLKKITDEQEVSIKNFHLATVAKVLLIVIVCALFFVYLALFRPRFNQSVKNTLFFLIMLVGTFAMVSCTVRYTSVNVYILPFALLPVIVRVFFDSRTALFEHLTAVLLTSFVVPDPYVFVLVQTIVGMVAIFTLKDLTQRSQLLQTAVWIFATYSLIYIGYSLLTEGSFEKVEWLNFALFGINSLLLLFAYGFIYIFERIFGFLSSVTLVELSNVNNKLMTEFAEKAPGTFQHSLQVANLATEASKKINANALLVRTGALYHDIGKMNNPILFTENQVGTNPLAQMSYEEAAQMVIKHVTEGVRLAEKNGLPKQIIDFIRMHHGMSKTRYFYNSFCNAFPDREVDESKFTYPGPRPSTKETAILMMADAVEAASRSMTEHTEEKIDNLVEKIVDGQIAEGSFKDAPITFQNIETVKTVFKEKLKNIYHGRISYPELNKK